jgi:hypothetical protein
MNLNLEPINRFSAWLSGDLPIPAEEAYQRFTISQYREEVAEELASGIREATYISNEKLREIMESPRFCKWSRVLEAVARRTEPLTFFPLGATIRTCWCPYLIELWRGKLACLLSGGSEKKCKPASLKIDAAFEEFVRA